MKDEITKVNALFRTVRAFKGEPFKYESSILGLKVYF